MFTVVFLLFCCVSASSITETLESAKKETIAALTKIRNDWEVDKYPLFLKSCGMHKSSWELMKHRFMEVIVKGLEKKDATFDIAFMGSSVTAGHDSFLNQSYPVLVQEHMERAFAKTGIKFTTTNNAIGNNPCLPYDACVATFAGTKADMVHWEQSYNCFDKDPVEQFARQASFMPKKPLVVYSDSATFNWEAKACVPLRWAKTKLSEEEESYVKYLNTALSDDKMAGDAIEMIVSELNQGEFKQRFNRNVVPLIGDYAGMGIQGFSHWAHEPYKCLGPYIPEFQKGAANWHPSVQGHRLRAGHHAFFWLLGFREALIVVEELMKKGQSLGTIADELGDRRKKFEGKHPLRPEAHLTNIPDRVKCYTAVEPHENQEFFLPNAIIGGNVDMQLFKPDEAKANVFKDKWGLVDVGALVLLEWVHRHNAQNHRDHKYIMYGNKDAGPVSFRMQVDKDQAPSPVFVCEVSVDFGLLAEGFGRIRPFSKEKPEVDEVGVYYTLNVPETDFKKHPFVFDETKAKKTTYKTENNNFCIEGGLYPTIAVSDAVNVAGHLYAAHIALGKSNVLACGGFLTVALAGAIGVLRFGFSESMFSGANSDMADVAAFVGLPAVGLSFIPWVLLSVVSLGYIPLLNDTNRIILLMTFMCIEATTRSSKPAVRKACKIALNLLFFIAPCIYHCYINKNMNGMGAIILFTVAGLNVDRHKEFLGMRLENWFHYCIAVAAPFIAMAL